MNKKGTSDDVPFLDIGYGYPQSINGGIYDTGSSEQ